MSQEALYLKYRPLDFETIMGQAPIRQTLQNAVRFGKIAHAYLFTGPRGTGKTTTARIIAKAINCLQLKENGDPCNTCTICTAINNGNLVDIIELDAASHTSVDDIREIIEKSRFSPTQARKKVYIIDEVHMLSKPAFNALLKTLEEPPEHVHFILATTEYQKVPETIISRCQRFDFRRINEKDIKDYLRLIIEREQIVTEDEALDLIARYAEGGMRDAISLVDKIQTNHQLTAQMVKENLGISGQELVRDFYITLRTGQLKAALSRINEIYDNGANIHNFTKELLQFLRGEMLEAAYQNDRTRLGELLSLIGYFEEALSNLRTAFIPQLPLEMAIIKHFSISPAPASSTETPPPPSPSPLPPAATPQKEESFPTTDLATANQIREKWLDIIADIPSSIHRTALKSTVLESWEDNVLTLNCRSNIEMEKINTPKVRDTLAASLTKHIGITPQIRFLLRKIELTPEESKKEKINANDVAELFGGEVV